MKELRKILLVLILMLVVVPFNVKADEKVINIYLFYGDGCPHCAAEEEFLDEYLKDKDNVKLYKYEVWYDKTNQEYLQKVQKKLNDKQSGVPYTVIGDKVLLGYMDGVTDVTIKNYIDYYYNNDYVDYVGKITNVSDIRDDSDKINARKKEDKKIIYDDPEVEISTNKNKDENKSTNKQENKLEKSNEEVLDNVDNMLKKYPVLNKLSAKKISLPLLSIVLGLVDGFNPCAMWILIFLITMLFNMKDRKKMWILGLTFIVTSGIVYLLFMLTWLNLATFISKLSFIRLLIALIALVVGIINISKFANSLIKKDEGCDVVDKKDRKNIMNKIIKITTEKKFILALFGIIALAASVNIIELMCSIGIPLLFTQILAMNNLSTFEYAIYMFLYILFFLIDDIIIFVGSMITLKVTGLSTKYTKFSHLIGGIIMLLIGLLLIIKPELLNFNF